MEKRFKSLKKWLAIAGLLLLLLLTGMVAFSPYGKQKDFPYKLVKHTVEINAPVDSVFNLLGKSSMASSWSVYVDHITPLNADSFPDGTTGSRRRCFCENDETGIQWDELITENIPDKKRQLVLYNLKGFPITADHLATEQLYEKLSENKCSLTFTLFFKDSKPGLLESLKTYFAGYKIKDIYSANMYNIKRIAETGK